ncbi:hypothetical protein K5I29_04630 [Flavobacterium agricola]|uniref:Uncharacterized protein n=1 Tax=Flavobacterium agricola TaxID=2870839 RepID=A0ABY6M0V5_9FLAO|nr:hypothetical protein [Flavobacterium agricola]UYW02194.1 hypothetical protein K5I29_04630 [Flavobacterium agricola]
MKIKMFILFVFFSAICATESQAQVNININVNSLPEWAPKRYIPETRYYFIPEIGVYYDIPTRMYIYPHKKGWVRNRHLPKHYAKYNLNACYKVSLYDIGPNPYVYYDTHVKKYPKNYRKGNYQPVRNQHHGPKKNGYNNGKGNKYGHDKGPNKHYKHPNRNHVDRNSHFNR